jgi:O-methyltransferase involved in polyketide biosynthesis
MNTKTKKGFTHEKISFTALLVAQMRVFSDIPFVMDIAEECGVEESFEILLAKIGGANEHINESTLFMEARHKITDQIIKQRGINQVLELATGLSPRGLALTDNPEIIYVATDLPKILEQSKLVVDKIITKKNLNRPNLHFQVANALDKRDIFSTSKYFKSGEPIAVVCEGLLRYLSRGEQKQVAANILDFLKINGGIWVTPDTSTRDAKSSKDARKLDSHFSSQIDREVSGAFADNDDLRKFFSDAGFSLEEYFWPEDIINNLGCIKSLGIEKSTANKILKGRKSLILTPKKK